MPMHDVSLWTLVCINEHIDIDNAHDNHDSNYCDYHWDNNNDGDDDDDDDDRFQRLATTATSVRDV